jgi:hypothetical protein
MEKYRLGSVGVVKLFELGKKCCKKSGSEPYRNSVDKQEIVWFDWS